MSRERNVIHELPVQLRRHMPVIAATTLALLACDTASAVRHDAGDMAAIAAMLRVMAWCFAACYAGYELFRYPNGGDDCLLLMARRDRSAGLWVRAGAMFVLLAVPVLAELPFQAVRLGHAIGAADTARVLGYQTVCKLTGFVAFLMIVAVASYLSALLRGTVLAAIATLLAYAAVTIGQAYATVVPMVRSGRWHWTIGTSEGFLGSGYYLNVLSVMMWRQSPSPAATALSTITPGAIAANVILIVLLAILWRIIHARIPINYIK